jgi:hypothetical protein
MEMKKSLLSPQKKFNCLVLQMCIWNVNVRNVENDGCCAAVDVGIFSRRKQTLLLRVRKHKLWLHAFAGRRNIIIGLLCLLREQEY